MFIHKKVLGYVAANHWGWRVQQQIQKCSLVCSEVCIQQLWQLCSAFRTLPLVYSSKPCSWQPDGCLQPLRTLWLTGKSCSPSLSPPPIICLLHYYGHKLVIKKILLQSHSPVQFFLVSTVIRTLILPTNSSLLLSSLLLSSPLLSSPFPAIVSKNIPTGFEEWQPMTPWAHCLCSQRPGSPLCASLFRLQLCLLHREKEKNSLWL